MSAAETAIGNKASKQALACQQQALHSKHIQARFCPISPTLAPYQPPCQGLQH